MATTTLRLDGAPRSSATATATAAVGLTTNKQQATTAALQGMTNLCEPAQTQHEGEVKLQQARVDGRQRQGERAITGSRERHGLATAPGVGFNGFAGEALAAEGGAASPGIGSDVRGPTTICPPASIHSSGSRSPLCRGVQHENNAGKTRGRERVCDDAPAFGLSTLGRGVPIWCCRVVVAVSGLGCW